MRTTVAIFAVTWVLVACGSGDDDDGPASAAVPSTTTTVPTTSVVAATTTPERLPDDPIVAVTEDGRVVTLKANTGAELTQLGTVAVTDLAGGSGEVAVSQTRGVAYFSEPYGGTGRIWSVPVAGGSPTLVAQGSFPAIHADGTMLAFVRPPSTVVLLDVATGDELAAVTWASDDTDFFDVGSSITRLEWSPDGDALVVQADYEGSRSFVFRPGEHVTLSDAELVSDALVSPTWTGPDLVMGVRRCCYPEFAEPPTLRIYRLGVVDEPALEIHRAVAAVDWRLTGDRSAEINSESGAAAGTITLRNAAGREAWTTDGRFLAVAA